MHLLRLWFGFSVPVTRKVYIASGFGLMAFKYLVETVLIYCFTARIFPIWTFLNPMLSYREEIISAVPEWFGWTQFAWSLPFIWIAVSMSLRRAVDAGLSPWLSLIILLPFINCLFMLILCVIPKRGSASVTPAVKSQNCTSRLVRNVLGVSANIFIAFAALGLSVYVLGDYSAALFLGAPVVMGVASGYISNYKQPQSIAHTLGIATLAIVLPGLTILLFALEGLICLLMAAPIAIPLALIGSMAGRAIASTTATPKVDTFILILILPLLSGAEHVYRPKRVPRYSPLLTSMRL